MKARRHFPVICIRNERADGRPADGRIAWPCSLLLLHDAYLVIRPGDGLLRLQPTIARRRTNPNIITRREASSENWKHPPSGCSPQHTLFPKQPDSVTTSPDADGGAARARYIGVITHPNNSNASLYDRKNFPGPALLEIAQTPSMGAKRYPELYQLWNSVDIVSKAEIVYIAEVPFLFVEIANFFVEGTRMCTKEEKTLPNGTRGPSSIIGRANLYSQNMRANYILRARCSRFICGV